MFSLADELKFYEPGLEVVEESLSGDRQKDLLEMMRLLLQEKASQAPATEDAGADIQTESADKTSGQ